MDENRKKLEKIGENWKKSEVEKKVIFLKMSFLLQISCVLISWYTSEEMEGRKLVKIGGKLVKMGENG